VARHALRDDSAAPLQAFDFKPATLGFEACSKPAIMLTAGRSQACHKSGL
jgi:hypothetical protein